MGTYILRGGKEVEGSLGRRACVYIQKTSEDGGGGGGCSWGAITIHMYKGSKKISSLTAG